ncbi:MAG: YeeE/YedE family protein [Burkholderiaceae bacterium]
MELEPINPMIIVGCAFLIGALFGYAGNKSDFCTMGAISDVVNMGDWTRMRMWFAAIGMAIVGVALLQATGAVNFQNSLYATARLPWLSHIVGGVAFGVGMTLASGCTSKTLIRLGGGNLKSIVVFVVLAISAYMTLKGLFGVWRVAYLDPIATELSTSQLLPQVLAGQWGLSGVQVWLPLLIGTGFLAFGLWSAESRVSVALQGGLGTGVLVVLGWYLTGHVAHIAEHPETLEAAYVATTGNRPESLSLVAPYAYTVELLMFWSDASRHVTFGIAVALGIVTGSFVYAISHNSFREESFPNAADLKRHLVGAVLMGFGGITALGCTIGQGLTGVSTLSIGAFITLVSIIAGAAITMKIDYWRLMREA